MSKNQQTLQKLSELGPNWDTYGAKPITEQALKAAMEITGIIANKPPSIVPTVEGGIQLEWHTCGHNIEIEIGPDGQQKEG